MALQGLVGAMSVRAEGKAAESGMAKRIVEACEQLRSAGTKMA